MAVSQRVVPPPPIQQPMIGPNGFLSPVWANWFNLFYRRAGESDVTPVGDLEVQQAYDFDTLPSSVNRDLETLSKGAELETAPSLGQIRLAMATFEALLESQGQNRARKDPDQEILAAIDAPAVRRYSPEEKFIPGLVNAIVNGGCISAQRPSQTLTNSFVNGPVDLIAVKADGTVGAGTVEQVTSAFTLGEVTGHGIRVNGATLSAGSEAIHFRHRIESYLATRFVNKSANFSCRMYHDVGSSVDAVVTISKADSTDNFGAVTQISQQTVPIPHDTNFTLEIAIPDMGDCKTGIEINIDFDCGAITTKNVYLAQLQLSIGQERRAFENRPLALELGLIHRYLRPLVGFVGVANSASNMQVPLGHPGMRAAPSYTATGALDVTDGYTADHSQSGADVNTVHENTADNGRVSCGLFSGLTSGRFYIHRGTSDKILASAEL